MRQRADHANFPMFESQVTPIVWRSFGKHLSRQIASNCYSLAPDTPKARPPLYYAVNRGQNCSPADSTLAVNSGPGCRYYRHG